MLSDCDSLKALKNIVEQVDLILETTPDLPQNRTGRSRELLRAALAIADDLIAQHSESERSHAAALGSKGGRSVANTRGAEYFRELAAKRKTRSGGRPKRNP